MNILAEFKKLKDTLAGFLADQTKATLATLTEFSTKLTTLETGAMAELTTANTTITDLRGQLVVANTATATSNTKFTDLQAHYDEFNALLSDACLNANLIDLKGADGKPLAADATPEVKRTAMLAVPLNDKFKAYQGALNAAFVKANVPNATMPAAPLTSTTQNSPTGKNTMKRADFFKLTAKQQLEAVNKDVTLVD